MRLSGRPCEISGRRHFGNESLFAREDPVRGQGGGRRQGPSPFLAMRVGQRRVLGVEGTSLFCSSHRPLHGRCLRSPDWTSGQSELSGE